MVKMLDVENSSCVKQIGYDSDTAELHVIFKNEGHYIYRDVPRSEWADMLHCHYIGSSMGKFINTYIKKVYSFRKEGGLSKDRYDRCSYCGGIVEYAAWINSLGTIRYKYTGLENRCIVCAKENVPVDKGRVW